MPDPTSKPPLLVEVLEAAERFDLVGLYSHSIGPESCGDYLDRDDVLKIAAPYAARLAALEKVAEAATAILKSQDDHAMTLDVRLVLALRTFLAAVPEIKEKDDGS